MQAEKLMPFDKLKNAVSKELSQVNKIIINTAQSHAELLPTITQHLTASGGKRLRPILTLACAKLLNISGDAHIKLAAAVEFIHTATLLHDDVIDESKTRRGLKTANNIWGNKASILVGDYLLSKAFILMVSANNMKALDMLSRTAAQITESEIWQLELLEQLNLPFKDYIKLVTGKTAVLFASACAVSAIVTNQPQPIIDKFYNFGLNLGICFQITDDTMDYFSHNKAFGKTIGNDFQEGKITLPYILTYKAASQSDKRKLKAIFTNRNQATFNELIALYEKYNCLAKIIEICNTYNKAGQNHIKEFEKDKFGAMLADALAYAVYREF